VSDERVNAFGVEAPAVSAERWGALFNQLWGGIEMTQAQMNAVMEARKSAAVVLPPPEWPSAEERLVAQLNVHDRRTLNQLFGSWRRRPARVLGDRVVIDGRAK
jgi:hypothetical protein